MATTPYTPPQYNFTVTQLDLDFILKQIRIAEASTNPITGAAENLRTLVGSPLLPYGLRTVDGTWNNLLPGQERFGAADNIMPRLVAANLQAADNTPAAFLPPGSPAVPTSYTQTSGNVFDSQPRVASNLISDQTANNPAAVAAALQLAGHPNPFAEATVIAGLNTPVQTALAAIQTAQAHILAAGTDATALATAQAELTAAKATHTTVFTALTTELTNAGLTVTENGTIGILNLSPDIGLSPSFNGWMTFFGQFFDHGLDLVTKGSNGTVFVPLLPDDPLYVAGSQTNFMVLTRATQVNGPGADGILGTADDTTHESINTTTPFIDQNQTYTSHPSHQVFLREYHMVGGKPLATGHLLNGAFGEANWGEVKAQAAHLLGIQLLNEDVGNVPLLATDRYGEFLRGPNGFPQIVTVHGLVEGNPLANGGLGVLLPADTIRTDHQFLIDIAHGAAPGFFDHDHNPATAPVALVADSDNVVGSLPNPAYDPSLPVGPNNSPILPQTVGTYDDELLDRHFVTGDGRGNENIGLTTVHSVFHSEHNRLVEDYKHTVLASGDLTFINEWLLTDLTSLAQIPTTEAGIAALNWDGERLFQAGRFVTEMQYQHLVFEEFARAVQPAVNPFVFTNSPDIDPAIVAEFAHVVYRFGHSMLTETVTRTDFNNVSTDAGLIQVFLNPLEFNAGGVTESQAIGSLVRGMSHQTGNAIDEFVTEALRNNLVGLPLDLATLNMARARETGMPSFNEARAAFYAASGATNLKPFTSWVDMVPELKNPMSIVNFIAAYGTYDTITSATTLAGKRAAAMNLVFGDASLNPADATIFNNNRAAFLNSTGPWNATNSGLNDVDLWIGGLAERTNEFGGMLGATFNYVFENQMERLQNGDRFYYLSRTQGTNMLNELEANTFSKLVMRNSDLGTDGSSHVSGLLFGTADYTLEINQTKQVGADPMTDNPILQVLHPMVIRHAAGADVNGDGHADGGYIQFTGGEHVVLGGTAGNDTLKGGNGIDTLWGDGGNDRLDGGNEADHVFGGDGDDIITDTGTPVGGADFLYGDEGNDVISSGMGNDIVFGGGGKDFIITGDDATEVFAGRGDDFILGGSAPDGLMGNEGNDWIEGGEGFDGLSGENSELFFNSPIIGHDVLNGQGNDTDYDGESGDDIMVQGPGIQRSNGMFGFDWGIHKGDPFGANSDLGIPFFPAQTVFTLRDRFDSVEGLSGWIHNDILTGASALKGAAAGAGAGPGNPPDESALKSQNVSLIDGLAQLLGFDTPAELALLAAMPINTTVLDTTTGAEIILGGGGSDVIKGNLGNDILDGDAWLNVRIRVTHNVNEANTAANEWFTVNSMNDIKARMLTGEINPGQLHIVREILQSTTAATDVDTAVYSGNASEYSVLLNGDGSRTITHTPVVGGGGGGAAIDDGVDTIRNFERIQFADRTIVISGTNAVGTGNITISDTAPIEGSVLLASGVFADANGVNLASVLYSWEAQVNTNQWIEVGVGNLFTPGNPVVNLPLRVKATFLDLTGVTETVYSVATAPVVNVNDLPVGRPTISGNAVEDQILTAASLGISDADGMGPISFQWTRNGVAIAGATNPTLTLGDADAGAVIRVQAIYTDLHGTLETVTSLPTVPVVNVNDAPFGSPTAVLANGTEDVVYTVTAASLLQGFTDVDPGAVLTVTGLTASSGTLVNNNNGTWTITQAANFNGPVTLTYNVTDGISPALAATQSFTITAVNDAPTGAPTAILAAGTEDTAYIVSAASLLTGFSDVDVGTVLAVSGLTASNGTVVNNGNGTFTVTPAANFNGTMGLSYSVIDGSGGSIAATRSYSVTTVNDTPVVALPLADQTATQGAAFSFAIPAGAFTDVDAGDILSLSATLGTGAPLPAWLSFNAATRTFSGTPLNGDVGNLSVRVTVTDTAGASAVDVFALNVLNVNDPTQGAVTINNLTPDLLRTLTVSHNLTDIDGPLNLLGYQWQSSPNGANSWSNIAGATGASFTTTTPGAQLRVVASYTVGGGAVETMVSAAVTAAVGAFHIILGTNAAGETLVGTTVADQITGLGGNDVLVGGAGNDVMAGGAGNDVYEITEAGDVVLENAGEGIDTVYAFANHTLAANVENLIFSNLPGNLTGTGNNLGNLMVGGSGADTFDGLGGNDVLIGGAGNDILAGGAGDDVYEVTETGDVVFENANEGIDTVYAYANHTLSANVENLIFSNLPGNLIGTGNDLGNLMMGGNGADTFNGLGGNDVLVGGAGNDILSGGQGDDTYEVTESGDVVIEAAGEGIDTVYAFADYTLSANVENLIFSNLPGNLTGTGNNLNNLMMGGNGADTFNGLGGNDVLIGGAGNDILAGGLGDDTYEVTETGDVVIEAAGAGNDTVWAHVNYTLSADVETLLYGGTGNFTGTGNSLNNLIMGGIGNDNLNGGAGADTLVGGSGSDTFTFSAMGDSGVGAGNRDVIGDFLDGTDHIDLSGIDANTSNGAGVNDAFSMIGVNAFSGVAGQLRYVLVGTDTLLQADVNGDSAADFEVVLTGTHTFTNAADLVL